MTHYIEAFTRLYRGQQQAMCGAFVDPSSHSDEPTCPACLAKDAEDARALEELRNMQPDPALLVKPRDFDPLAGYTVRGERKGR